MVFVNSLLPKNTSHSLDHSRRKAWHVFFSFRVSWNFSLVQLFLGLWLSVLALINVRACLFYLLFTSFSSFFCSLFSTQSLFSSCTWGGFPLTFLHSSVSYFSGATYILFSELLFFWLSWFSAFCAFFSLFFCLDFSDFNCCEHVILVFLSKFSFVCCVFLSPYWGEPLCCLNLFLSDCCFDCSVWTKTCQDVLSLSLFLRCFVAWIPHLLVWIVVQSDSQWIPWSHPADLEC